MIILTETWLDNVIFSSQLFGNQYSVYRTDRNATNSVKSRGDGVLIAVSSEYSSYHDPATVCNSLEQLWVRIDTRSHNISVGVIYLPPDRKDNLNDIQHHIDSIGSVISLLGPNDLALQFGDYNQSAISWTATEPPSVDMDHLRLSVASCALLDGFDLHGMTQINTIKNSRGRLLDLILANDFALPSCVLRTPVEALLAIDENHPPLEVGICHTMPLTFESSFDGTRYDFGKANYSELNSALQALDWNFLNLTTDVDETVEYFTNAVNTIIASHVPLARPPPKPIWSNSRLRSLRRRRSAALRKYCNNRSQYFKQQ